MSALTSMPVQKFLPAPLSTTCSAGICVVEGWGPGWHELGWQGMVGRRMVERMRAGGDFSSGTLGLLAARPARLTTRDPASTSH